MGCGSGGARLTLEMRCAPDRPERNRYAGSQCSVAGQASAFVATVRTALAVLSVRAVAMRFSRNGDLRFRARRWILAHNVPFRVNWGPSEHVACEERMPFLQVVKGAMCEGIRAPLGIGIGPV